MEKGKYNMDTLHDICKDEKYPSSHKGHFSCSRAGGGGGGQ